MKSLKTLLFVAIACIAFVACQSKESTMNDLRDLKAQVTANADNYTVDDWKKFLAEFQQADSILNTYELTDEEREEIKKIKNACAKYVLKGNATVKADELKNAVNDAIDGAADAAKGFLN